MKNKISFSPGICIFLGACILLLPVKWIAAVILAGLFHELCHLLAIRLCGGEVLRLRIGGGGAVISAAPMGLGQELLCALAGPVGSLLLLSLSRFLPRTALCAGFHALYNLLPLYPLDGGRALRCLAGLVLPENTANRFCSLVQTSCLALILLLGLYGTFFLRLGLVPVIAAAAVCAKFSCKVEQ